MKKKMTALLVCIMVLSCVGCSSSNENRIDDEDSYYSREDKDNNEHKDKDDRENEQIDSSNGRDDNMAGDNTDTEIPVNEEVQKIYFPEIAEETPAEAKIAKNKDLYYHALREAQTGWLEGTDDSIPFIKYILGTILAAYKDFEDRFALVETKRPAIETVRAATQNKIGS